MKRQPYHKKHEELIKEAIASMNNKNALPCGFCDAWAKKKGVSKKSVAQLIYKLRKTGALPQVNHCVPDVVDQVNRVSDPIAEEIELEKAKIREEKGEIQKPLSKNRSNYEPSRLRAWGKAYVASFAKSYCGSKKVNY